MKACCLATIVSVILSAALPLRADEAATIAALLQAGFNIRQRAGTTEVSWSRVEWTPQFWQRLDEISSLTALVGTMKCADNAGLEVLTKLPKLETMYLNGSTFDDKGFATLAKISSLKSLSFDHNQVFTGKGASALRVLPNLRFLRFGGCMKFTGEGLKAVAEIKQLESLELNHVGTRDDDLLPLARMPNLKYLMLNVSFNSNFTAAGLKQLVQIQSLERLEAGEFKIAYEGGLDALAGLKQLKTLDLLHVDASASDIQRLRTAMLQTQIKWTPIPPKTTPAPKRASVICRRPDETKKVLKSRSFGYRRRRRRVAGPRRRSSADARGRDHNVRDQPSSHSSGDAGERFSARGHPLRCVHAHPR